ncbi:unnamed protein product [Ectocarpus fasciculatus]
MAQRDSGGVQARQGVQVAPENTSKRAGPTELLRQLAGNRKRGGVTTGPTEEEVLTPERCARLSTLTCLWEARSPAARSGG